MLAAILNYLALCFWYALTALKSDWSQLYLFFVDVFIIYLASISLVPVFGIMGAIYAIVIVMGFHFIVGGITVGWVIAKRSIN